jgi:hypothetical protein
MISLLTTFHILLQGNDIAYLMSDLEINVTF